MNQVQFIDSKCITQNEHRLLTAGKTAKTKTNRTLKEISNAIGELQREHIKPSQANVIRRLKGKKCKRTIIKHWKTLFSKQDTPSAKLDVRDPAQQKPFEEWSNSDLVIPTLEQEIKLNPHQSPNLLLHYLNVMRAMRIKELQDCYCSTPDIRKIY